ncbi:polysaccharide pyruvyl transferase family protein [uncultured Methanoculleus sp.]|jgi:colanic acid/amylovoran biosynthesis protein|uniref:polysaccharide pyruvyl transferase family protein n=1 Tax=uncultured Methanoculleus sp. TaxID=183762 RepID=UPI003204B946
MKILILGLTSSKLGGMEYHNLGNYAIMEPLIVQLKDQFLESEILTSVQMSHEFCERFGITSLRDERFWTYGLETGIITAKDLVLVFAWATGRRIFNKDLQWLIDKSKLLKEIYNSDLVIDFSGDMYGDNAGNLSFLEDNAKIVMSKILGKPVVLFIGSPGPFNSAWRRILAKNVLNRIDLITNRDPISTEILNELGVKNTPIYDTACPAFLFERRDDNEMAIILRSEGLLPKTKPLIGLIICGWNMAKPPFSKLPREEYELRPFVELIKHILDNSDAHILLMSHQNKTDDDGNLVKGNDHAIISQIFSILEEDGVDVNRVLMLQGLYDASTSKSIIGVCDVLISGRIHGAVAGLSQCIPTVIIDYGHEPKAHKLKGFARVTEMEEYICNPASSQDMIDKYERCWNNRKEIQSHLREHIPHVQSKAMSNFTLIKDLTKSSKASEKV